MLDAGFLKPDPSFHPVIDGIFHEFNQPAIKGYAGYAHDYGTPDISEGIFHNVDNGSSRIIGK